MKPRDLISLKEIAEVCKVHQSAVSNWKKRHSVNFPEPWGTWPMGSLYVRTEIEDWIDNRVAEQHARHEAIIARLEK